MATQIVLRTEDKDVIKVRQDDLSDTPKEDPLRMSETVKRADSK
jgi:hypothetical protein